MSNTNKLYPSPSIVLGIGKFGLASLEFLGEKWLSRQATGGDASLETYVWFMLILMNPNISLLIGHTLKKEYPIS